MFRQSVVLIALHWVQMQVPSIGELGWASGLVVLWLALSSMCGAGFFLMVVGVQNTLGWPSILQVSGPITLASGICCLVVCGVAAQTFGETFSHR